MDWNTFWRTAQAALLIFCGLLFFIGPFFVKSKQPRPDVERTELPQEHGAERTPVNYGRLVFEIFQIVLVAVLMLGLIGLGIMILIDVYA
ncbi:hypothetical protein [Stratiformator vulcanicus]|uniref:Uncharacterized protein n=1 Tax=Stratiformator vulcanicus TaxID=2527980 RepID=A0A517R188_9PLAN|nr:hypothetical protein [Stratiformator vulcanicus]QDT37610.1 hypothetical protein Pan189_19900 [Stratiformator vulcanicus]